MTIETKYDLKQKVVLASDPHKLERIIIGIKVNPDLSTLYYLALGPTQSDHYECEIEKLNKKKSAGFKK